MTAGELLPLVEKLRTARVLCVGDLMLDRFVYGSVTRISPEAPIPVITVERETAMLGGAGNVVRNLIALGAETCFISVVGDDQAGREVTLLVAAEDRVEPHLLVEARRQTTIKTRFVAQTQQMLRADRETVTPVSASIAVDLRRRAFDSLRDHNVLVLSDYDKGVLGAAASPALIEAARAEGKTVIVDPKGSDYRRYAGASLVTPNRRELREASGMPTDDQAEVIAAAKALITRYAFGGVLVTLSQEGMILIRPEGEELRFPARAREVFDVSGAGDTVVATLAAALAAGVPIESACSLANLAAGVVVGKAGTAACTADELIAAIQGEYQIAGAEKRLSLATLPDQLRQWRAQSLRIGFTNGCFDLIHPGHVSLLAQARAACDRLVVGLNSDASVARLKGPTRPVQGEESRAIVLASLGAVDAVIVFDDDTPISLIEAIKPDVLVKGADYTRATVVGAEFVEQHGGRVVLAELTPGQSTTSMVRKLGG